MIAAIRRRLRVDRRGSAMLQFAMVAAPFVALMIANLETALAFFTQQGLQTAAETAARTISTGQVQAAGTTQSQFQTQVCATLMPYLNCSNLYIDVEQATSFSAVDTTKPTITFDPKTGKPTNTFNYSVGGSGAIVIVRLMYLWPISTGPLGLFSTEAGTKVLYATTVAKTEPYS